jgi:hypothetical protein
MSKMRRNCDAPHLGRALADKAAELGPALHNDSISKLVPGSFTFNSVNPDARTKSMAKRFGKTEADLNPGYTSKNKLGGTPVRIIEQHTDSYNK